MRVLSTKKLLLNQKELLLNAKISFVEYDAIDVIFLKPILPNKIDHAIFTSQNGVHSVKDHLDRIEVCYCVGEKTQALLIEKGKNVQFCAENSQKLGEFLINNHKNDSFSYFCSTNRRDELPQLLKSHKIELFEHKTYKIEPIFKKFDQKWDGILFFSPSGVKSFTELNSIDEATAICIGETTAEEARKFTKNIVIANSTTVESVIAKAAVELAKKQMI